jgi:hypothetical protein
MQRFLNRGPQTHYGVFFMYWGCRLKISIALNPKKKTEQLYFYPYKGGEDGTGDTLFVTTTTTTTYNDKQQ